jgi:hypothetical protein
LKIWSNEPTAQWAQRATAMEGRGEETLSVIQAGNKGISEWKSCGGNEGLSQVSVPQSQVLFKKIFYNHIIDMP